MPNSIEREANPRMKRSVNPTSHISNSGSDSHAGAAASRRRRTSESSQDFAPLHFGPNTLEGVMQVPADLLLRLKAFAEQENRWADVEAELRANMHRGIVVTTSFSGSGAYEAMMVQVLDEAARMLGTGTPCVKFYSATEVDPTARSALLQHDIRSRPMHVFGDLLERLPKLARDQLQKTQAEMLSLWEMSKLEHASGNIGAADLSLEHSRLAKKWVEYMHDVVVDVDFQETAYCYVHKGQCPLSPKVCGEFSQHLWYEVAGSTCVAFASPGKNAHWLHESALVFYCWLYSSRYFDPHAIIHECVGAFPAEIFDGVLNGDIGKQLKCISSAPTLESDEGGLWEIVSFLFSPEDLGVPIARRRRYTLCLRAMRTMGIDFRSAFFSTLHVTAQVFTEAIHDWPVGSLPQTNGDMARLEGYQVEAHKLGFCSAHFDDWKIDFLVVNIAQREEYMNLAAIKRREPILPTLLKTSILFDLIADQEVPVCVHWVAQGFPHPSFFKSSCAVRKYFPFPHLVRQRQRTQSSKEPGADTGLLLSDKAQRNLTGNAMHWAQAAASLVYVLGCTRIL